MTEITGFVSISGIVFAHRPSRHEEADVSQVHESCVIFKYMVHFSQVKVPQSSLQITQGTSQLLQVITHVIICSTDILYLFSCVSGDSQLQLFAVAGRKCVWEFSPSPQQQCPVIPILACTLQLVSCWFDRTWYGFYLNVF